jgi:sirohydrochlorin cobaltochelatase
MEPTEKEQVQKHPLKKRMQQWLGTLAIMSMTAPLALEAQTQKEHNAGILLVAFGTTVPEAKEAYHHIEARVKAAFPNYEVRWAYTSGMVRRKLKTQGIETQSPAVAITQMSDEGFKRIAVQSLHIIPGAEYSELQETVARLQNLPKGVESVEIDDPLITTHSDLMQTTQALSQWALSFKKKDEALVLMGHGSEHNANVYYPALQYYFQQVDPTIFIGTVEGYPTLTDVIKQLKNNHIKQVWLAPFMTVAGDHAVKDMSGDDDSSWKKILEKEGFTVKINLTGLGQISTITDIWIEHLKTTIGKLEAAYL